MAMRESHLKIPCEIEGGRPLAFCSTELNFYFFNEKSFGLKPDLFNSHCSWLKPTAIYRIPDCYNYWNW